MMAPKTSMLLQGTAVRFNWPLQTPQLAKHIYLLFGERNSRHGVWEKAEPEQRLAFLRVNFATYSTQTRFT